MATCAGEHSGVHLGVGGLQAHERAFEVEALEGGFGTADEGDDDVSLAGDIGALDEDVVAVDDVLVAHGFSAHLQGEDFAAADDVAERDAFGVLRGLDGQAGGDAAHQRQALILPRPGAGWEYVDGAAAIVCALQKALVLQVGDVFVHGCQRFEVSPRAISSNDGEYPLRWTNPVMKSSTSFCRRVTAMRWIIANKKRIYKKSFQLVR